jgi:3-deoxy-manno-octulosonate cytidylyltransferase (CMP-KDO synthetase)
LLPYIVVIPARYQSSRLPGKPLIKLNGIPMLVRTYQQCLKAVDASLVYVATDDERISTVCKQYNIKVVMTSDQCFTGTDRVAEVANLIDANTYINVQGDEPVFDPADLTALIAKATQYPEEVINGYCQISDEALYRSQTIPKVVARPDGRLLYMSRAAIPTTKKHEFQKSWRQVCAYAFPKAALQAFASVNSKTELEAIEDIEILRFLELGWDVRMIKMSDSSVAVDCPDDIERAEAAIRALAQAEA